MEQEKTTGPFKSHHGEINGANGPNNSNHQTSDQCYSYLLG
ncbi:hypothetical protein D082_06020 [Synechocystis sp. PCC 6714]|nr:hypothetical protein D082_06020 [Synechocystis sp. PCC 6714]